MEMALNAKNKLPFVTGSLPKPDAAIDPLAAASGNGSMMWFLFLWESMPYVAVGCTRSRESKMGVLTAIRRG